MSEYNDVIREAVAGYDFQPANTMVALEATVKGTKYKTYCGKDSDNSHTDLFSVLHH